MELHKRGSYNLSALVVGLVKGLEQGPQPPVGSMGCCFLWVAWARLSSPGEKKNAATT